MNSSDEKPPFLEARQVILEKLAWVLSIPAIVGLFIWPLTWAGFVLGHFWQYASILFVVMIWLGPFSSIIALMAAAKSGNRGTKRVTWFLINGGWLLISLNGFYMYFFARK